MKMKCAILSAHFSSIISAEKRLRPNFERGTVVLNCLSAATAFASGSLPSVGHVDRVRGVLTGGSRKNTTEPLQLGVVSAVILSNSTSWFTLINLEQSGIWF